MSFPRTSDVSKHLAREQRPQPKLVAKPPIVTESTDECLEAVAERAPVVVRKDPNSLKPAADYEYFRLHNPASGPVSLKVSNQLALHVVVNGHIASANYTVVAQNRDEVMVPENSPSVSMWPYMLNSAAAKTEPHQRLHG